MTEPVDSLLVAGDLAGADDVAQVIDSVSRTVGASGARVLLVDRQQAVLTVLGQPEARYQVEGTVAGMVFTSGVPIVSAPGAPGGARTVSLPLRDGFDRLGVLEVQMVDPAVVPVDRLTAFAADAAALVVRKSHYGDVIEACSRSRQMSLAAEMQWGLLPPRTFGTDRVIISGVVEPAYDIGGDAYDYALNGDVLHFALLDAMGHGLGAATLAAVSMASYRHSRRTGQSLAQTASTLDEVVSSHSPADRFVTGWLAQLDVSTGRLTYINAGHPGPWILRDGRAVKELAAALAAPFGLGEVVDGRVGPEPSVGVEHLEPGDRLLVFTDGVVEARSDLHGFFGEERLLDFLRREAASGQSAPEILRRLTRSVLAFQDGALQDDSSMLLVEWVADRPRMQRELLMEAVAAQPRR